MLSKKKYNCPPETEQKVYSSNTARPVIIISRLYKKEIMKSFFKSHSGKFFLRSFLITTTAIFLTTACKKNAAVTTTVDCSGAAKSFIADVTPVIQSSCSFDSDCHGTGSTSGPGPLLTYTQIAAASTAIHAAVSTGEMPLNGSLSAADKNIILCWIDNGSVNN